MSGQLLRAAGQGAGAEAHPRGRSRSRQGGQLRFVDPRTFGEMFVTDARRAGRGGARAGRPRLRPGRRADVVDRLRASCCSRRTTKLKALLMDQKLVAGIGNIYSDEILCAAGPALRPHRRHAVDAGDPPAVPGHGRDAARGGRSTAARRWPTSSTSTSTASPASTRTQHKVYDREGEPCRRCRTHDRAREVPGPLHLLLPQLPGLTARADATARARRCDGPSGRRRSPRSSGRAPLGSSAAMFLKSLTLKGFKSFADTTTLELEPGVTVVVGPNGSGKSNVVDAIALGARRAGAERGAQPEDGRRHLRRHRQAAGARPGRGQPHDRQLGRPAADRVHRGHDHPHAVPHAATASTRSTACRAGCSTCRSCCPTPASAASST